MRDINYIRFLVMVKRDQSWLIAKNQKPSILAFDLKERIELF